MQEELEHISDGKEKAGILEKENESLKQQIFSMQESVEGLEAAMEESRDVLIAIANRLTYCYRLRGMYILKKRRNLKMKLRRKCW